jgi:hypothetical protein
MSETSTAEVLDGARQKLYWGKGHVDRLSDEIAVFLDANLRSLRAEFDGEGYLVYPVLEAPRRTGLSSSEMPSTPCGARSNMPCGRMIMRTQRGQSLTDEERRKIQFPLTREPEQLKSSKT